MKNHEKKKQQNHKVCMNPDILDGLNITNSRIQLKLFNT